MATEFRDIDQARETAVDLLVRFGPRVLVAGALLAAGYLVGRAAEGFVTRSLERFHLDAGVSHLLGRIARVIVFALFAVLALQNLGVELLPLVAGLGVAGAGVALALQGVLGNLAAGLTIVFTRPFKVGEYVEIIGVEGRVDDISLFSTTLLKPDRSRVVVPNRKIVGEVLHNYGSIRQVEVVVGVAYDTDLNAAFAAVQAALAANPRVLRDPAPLVQVAELADSAVNLAVRPWVAVPDYQAARGELHRAVLEAFRERGISIPFPQREIRVLGGLLK